MEKNILQILENSTKKSPQKIVFGEEKKDITYAEFVENSKLIGSNIISKISSYKNPITIFIDKTINCLEAMMGVLYSGNFYTIVDTKSPEERAKNIVEFTSKSIGYTFYYLFNCVSTIWI